MYRKDAGKQREVPTEVPTEGVQSPSSYNILREMGERSCDEFSDSKNRERVPAGKRSRNPLLSIRELLHAQSKQNSLLGSSEVDLQKQRQIEQVKQIEQIKRNLPLAQIYFVGKRWDEHLKDGSAQITEKEVVDLIKNATADITVNKGKSYNMHYKVVETPYSKRIPYYIGFETEDGKNVQVYHIGPGSW